MTSKKQAQPVLCPAGHENPNGSTECRECALPVVPCEKEIASLLDRLSGKSSYFVPHIDGCVVGVGSVGSRIVTDLCRSFSGEVSGVAFLTVDSMPTNQNNTGAGAVQARFHEHISGNGTVGGMIYSGLGEQAAGQDDRLETYLHMSGIRSEDPSQAMFVTAALGGGTGGGMAPRIASLGRSINPKASVLAVAITPGKNEADHVHTNALHGVSRLVLLGSEPNADMIVLVNHDKLRQLRGVGRSGEDLRADKVVSYLLRLLQLDLHRSGVIRMCRVSRGMKIQAFVPCIAVGRSLEIFGSLGNVLESAWAYPLSNLEPGNVMASYLLLRVPGRMAREFPEALVTEEFEIWNRRHVPGITSSLVQVIQTEEQSDRVDACILLGGDDIEVALRDTIEGHRRFRTHVEKSSRWEEYGLSADAVAEAEKTIEEYDGSMRELRLSKPVASGDSHRQEAQRNRRRS